MSRFNSWQSGTAALMALAITAGTAAPIVTPTPAFAQSSYRDVSISAGTRIPVRYDKSEKVVVTPNETTPLTLKVATDVTSSDGSLLIPAGTQVVGQLQPAQTGDRKGTQFVARELVFNSDRRVNIDASSRVITRTERVTKNNSGNILKGAAAGGGAAAALSAITGGGKVPLGAVLGGGAAGAVGGLLLGRESSDVVVVYPNKDLSPLRLRSNTPVR